MYTEQSSNYGLESSSRIRGIVSEAQLYPHTVSLHTMYAHVQLHTVILAKSFTTTLFVYLTSKKIKQI